MKKLLSVLLCLIFCFAFLGCSNSNVEKENEEAKRVLMNVLEKKQTFIAKTSAISDKITEQTLSKYHFSTNSDAYYAFVPGLYTFADCDANGINELVVLDMMLPCYLVLRYDGEKVYGYNYTHIGDIKKFKSDGSFEPRLKDGESRISRFVFNDCDFEIIDKAFMSEIENKYFLDGKATDKETVKNYFDDWNENKAKAEWIKINE